MADWLKTLRNNLEKQDKQIDAKVSEIDDMLYENQEKIQGISVPLKQLTNNANKPTHAIRRWNYTLSRADEALKLSDSNKPSGLFLGDST